MTRPVILALVLASLTAVWLGQRGRRARTDPPSSSVIARVDNPPSPPASLPDYPDPLRSRLRAQVAEQGASSLFALYRRRADQHPRDPSPRAALGLLHLAANQPREALWEFRLAEALGSSDAIVYHYLGSYYRDNGDMDRAADAFGRQAALTPDDPRAAYDLGLSLLYSDELSESITALERCARLAPTYPDVYQALGNARFMRRELAAAESALKRCVELDTGNFVSWNGLGRTNLELGRLDEAERAFRRGLLLRPDRAELHEGLGRVFLTQPPTPASMQSASDSLKRALELNLTNGDVHLRLGQLYSRQGKLDNAAREFSQAIPLSRDPAPARYALVQVLRQRGKEQEAAGHLEKLKAATWSRKAQFVQRELDFNPRNVGARFELGLLYLQEKQYRKALHQFRVLSRLQPQDPRVHQQLARAYEAIGNPSLAAREKAKAESLGRRKPK